MMSICITTLPRFLEGTIPPCTRRSKVCWKSLPPLRLYKQGGKTEAYLEGNAKTLVVRYLTLQQLHGAVLPHQRPVEVIPADEAPHHLGSASHPLHKHDALGQVLLFAMYLILIHLSHANVSPPPFTAMPAPALLISSCRYSGYTKRWPQLYSAVSES